MNESMNEAMNEAINEIVGVGRWKLEFFLYLERDLKAWHVDECTRRLKTDVVHQQVWHVLLSMK
jgi:hypothetical protein